MSQPEVWITKHLLLTPAQSSAAIYVNIDIVCIPACLAKTQIKCWATQKQKQLLKCRSTFFKFWKMEPLIYAWDDWRIGRRQCSLNHPARVKCRVPGLTEWWISYILYQSVFISWRAECNNVDWLYVVYCIIFISTLQLCSIVCMELRTLTPSPRWFINNLV